MSTVSSTGTVVTSGSSSYVSSSASGLDTEALIEAAVAQKTARADTIEAKVTANEAKISAYESLQTLIQTLGDSITDLAAPMYSATASGNGFDEKSAYLTASDGSDATGVIAVSADSTATAASYEIEVLQLATAAKVAGSAMDSTAALGLTGAFSLGLDGGEAVSIDVTEDMTLDDIASAIQATSETSGVSASVIKVSAGSYRLVLSAQETAKDIVAATASGDDVLAALGLTDSGGAFANVIRTAQSSIVKIDGFEITSDSNELTDVVPGLSLSLLAKTADGVTVSLDVEPDVSGVKTAVTDFIDAYNALRDFVVTHQTVGSDGEVADDAVLFADSLLRGMAQAFGSLVSGSAGGDGEISHLSDIGVTLTDGAKLELSDETVLDNALLTNLSAFSAFFETRFNTSDSALKLLKNSTTASLSFTLDVTVDETGALSGATVGGQSGLFEVSGSRIVGVAGTAYEGLSFALVTDKAMSITVDLQQGLANKITALTEQYAGTNGMIDSQIDSLTQTDTALTQDADDIRTAAEAYRTKLVNRYSSMETEVQAAQLLQEQIQAILNGSSSDD